MQILVRRSGGFAGLTRGWRVDTDADPDGWSDLVDAVPRAARQPQAPVPDDYVWTITVASTTVRVPGRALDGQLAALVERVRTEGEPD